MEDNQNPTNRKPKSRIILPEKELFGVNMEEAYEKVMKGESKPSPPSNPNPQSGVLNKDGFIYVPATDLLVAKERSHQGLDWDKTHEALQGNGERMQTIPEFWAFVNYLKTDYQKINSLEANRILEDIFKIGDWRGEWLDARFEKKKKEFIMHSYHELKNGLLVPNKSETLESYLSKDCYAELSSINKQGLLTQESSNQNYIQGNNIYFWSPVDERVARFDAGSGGAGLDCGRGRSDTLSAFGVRRCVAKQRHAP